MKETPYSPGVRALFDVVHRLRASDGCPWDREQTHESLRPFLLEEAYEAVEAIDSGDDAKLMEELGDVLLQVAMHAEIAAEEGRFDAARVSEAAAAKMVSRHPHVFGGAVAASAQEVLHNWERNKQSEATRSGREGQSVFDRVPRALPALAWTYALQTRAARVGLPADTVTAGSIVDRAEALQREASVERRFELVGDLLFAAVALAQQLGVDPEDALRVAGHRFIVRMQPAVQADQSH